MADLTDFQKKKISRVFTTFFDVNKDGVIEWPDFEICMQKVREMHGWDTDGEKYLHALETLRLIWDGLKQYADENQDDKITEDEWLKMWQECIKVSNEKGIPEWQQRYMDFMFDVNDTSGDKLIDMEEYSTVYTNFGMTKEECEDAFKKFAENGNVDRDLYNKLWMEYFSSSDPSAKGNFIFGDPDKF